MVWVTSWPFAEYVRHAWPGAWVNSIFRKECGGPASVFIREAIAATRWQWPEIPPLGMITFVDPDKVKAKERPGECYIQAGFKHVGHAKDGKLAFQLLPADMPEPEPYVGAQMRLFG